MSKMEFFAKAFNCFCKELHLRGLLDRLPIDFMDTKTKTAYTNYIHKRHKLNYMELRILVFVKCALMTIHSHQIEMCSLRLMCIIRMEIHVKINESVN